MNKRIKVTGKVQGVFFRKSTQQKALELGVKGWVRNEADGSVLAEVEGEHHAVMAMESWLKEGPPNARVEALWVEEAEDKGYSDFMILY